MRAKICVMDEPGDLPAVASALAAFAARPAYAMSNNELRSSLGRLQHIATLVAGASAALVHEAAGRNLPREDGAASAVAWLRDLLRIPAADANRILALGQLIDRRPTIAAAVGSGALNPAQALAIGRVLNDVAAEEPAIVDKVEATLIDHATQFEPLVLRRLGERVLAHVSPDRADARLRDQLEREQRAAHQRRSFTLSPDGLGGTRITGILDTEAAATLAAAIEPLARPVRDDTGPDPRSAPARRADALIEVCRIALAAGGLPATGGIPPQLNITIDFDALTRDIAVGQLDTGALLSPSATRRLACQAHILPVILDGHSVPIDLGRTRRAVHRRRPSRGHPPRPGLRLPRLRSATPLDRHPPHPILGPRRIHRPRQRRRAVQSPPPTHPPQRMDRPDGCRPPARIHPTRLPRPATPTPPQPLPPTTMNMPVRHGIRCRHLESSPVSADRAGAMPRPRRARERSQRLAHCLKRLCDRRTQLPCEAASGRRDSAPRRRPGRRGFVQSRPSPVTPVPMATRRCDRRNAAPNAARAKRLELAGAT